MDEPTSRISLMLFADRYGTNVVKSKWMSKEKAEKMFADLWERLNG